MRNFPTVALGFSPEEGLPKTHPSWRNSHVRAQQKTPVKPSDTHIQAIVPAFHFVGAVHLPSKKKARG